MGILVFYIVIIVFVVIVKNAAKQSNAKSPEERYQEAVKRYNANMAAQTASRSGQTQQSTSSARSSEYKEYPGTASNNSAGSPVTVTVTKPASSSASQSESASGALSGQQSTTAYLDEKAKEDQREHAREKMEENKRVSKKYGGRPVAGRYLLGDPIPHNLKIVYCSYCGAENLVPHNYHGDKDCYFCRTHLERN